MRLVKRKFQSLLFVISWSDADANENLILFEIGVQIKKDLPTLINV